MAPQRAAIAAAARQTVVLMVCVTVLTCFVITAVVVAFAFAPEGANTVLLVSTLLATLPPTVASLVAVSQVRQVAAGQVSMAGDVERLANGLGDAKIRTAVADVVDPAFHAPGLAPQLELDRESIAEEHSADGDSHV